MVVLERVISDEEFTLSNLPIAHYRIYPVDVSHEGKSNHTVHISFNVLEPNKTVKFYHLDTDDFEKYALQANSTGGNLDPKKWLYKLDKANELKQYDIPISKSIRLHFIFAKITPSKIPIRVIIRESWEPDGGIVRILSGIPITNNQLSKQIRQLIHSSTRSLKILSPHTDLHLIDDLSEAITRGVQVQLIIRNLDQQNTPTTKQAFPHLQKILGKNLKSNDKIHARVLVKDDCEAIVMSSDLDQNSMQNLINCGVHISDSVPISQLNDFFEEIWKSSKNTS